MDRLRNEELNGDAVIAAYEMAKAVAATKGTIIEPFRKISDQDRARVESLLKAVVRVADSLKAQEIINRAESILNKLRRPPMYLMDLVSESRALRETVEHAVHYRRFYLYPPDKAMRVTVIAAEWKEALGSFPSIEDDVVQGLIVTRWTNLPRPCST